MTKRLMTVDDVIALLSREVEKAGSQRALARRMGVSVQYISKVINKRAPPSSAVLDLLGVREDGMRYVRVNRRDPEAAKPRKQD